MEDLILFPVSPAAGIIRSAMDIQGGFRIGPWTVSPLTGEIESDGRSVHLEPKVMEVLVVLAEKAESVVLRDELLNRVWGPRAAISDEPLTRCIAQLRQSLGDSSRDPRFIQTVPKRGYRLLVPALPVGAAPEPEPEQGPDRAGQSTQRHYERTSAFRPWQGVALIGSLTVVGLIALLGLGLFPDSEVDPCRYDQAEQSLEGGESYELCRQGVVQLNLRTADSIKWAILYFREALEREPAYGSALVNLARAFVLLPTYEEDFPEENCVFDENAPAYSDCYAAAIRLLERSRFSAAYIEPYSYGIQGYVFTKQRKWLEAWGAFNLAVQNTRIDPDMWQWYSQFLAAVGYLNDALDAIDRAHDLTPESPIILDRYGVILMWLGQDDAAEQRFRQADDILHEAYGPSELVRLIRQERWQDARQKLLDFSTARRNDDTTWATVFIEALRNPDDDALHDEAVEAAASAIEKRYLTGQLEYGAWVYLEEPERAIAAAFKLLSANPEALDVEFLFAPETRVIRDDDSFGQILAMLKLDQFWSDRKTGCPEIFAKPGERQWCD